MDYVLISYGLGVTLLAAACFALSKGHYSRFPWLWLALFGAACGLDELLEVFGFSTRVTPAFFLVQLCLMAAICLLSMRQARSAAERLAKSELRYRSLVEGSANIISLFDSEGRFVSVNPAGCQGLGIPEGDLIGCKLSHLLADDTGRSVNHYTALVMSGEKCSFETDFYRADGCTLTYHVVLNPVFDQSGKVSAFAGIWTDITENRLAQQKLQSNLRFMQVLMDTIPHPVFYKDAGGAYLGCNQAFAEYMGIPQDKVPGITMAAFAPPELAEKYRLADEALLRQMGSQVYEAKTRHGDGTLRDVVFYKAVFMNPDGSVGGIIGTMLDISERKRMEESLRSSEERCRAIIEQAADGIFLTDADGHYVEVNPRGCEIVGYTADELFNLSFRDLAHPEEMERNLVAFAALQGGGAWTQPFRLIRKDGTPVSVEINAKALTDGRIQGLVRDISERRRTEERLSSLNQCLLSFGPDCRENIDRLVALCGTLLDGSYAFYNRIDGTQLKTTGVWNPPLDFEPVGQAEGHVCTDLINSGDEEVVYIPDLENTPYAISDPNVSKYGFRTYLGKAVKCAGVSVGSLCVVHQVDYEPTQDDKRILEIAASAIAVEEDRLRAQEELKASEAKFSKAFRSSPLIVALSRVADGKFVDVSDSFTSAMGYSREETIGRSVMELKIWADAEERGRTLDEIRRDGSVKNREIYFRTKSGELMLALCSMEIIEAGDEQYLLNIATNISDRKAAEHALKASEARYRDLFEHASDYILTVDPFGRVSSINKAAEEALGFLGCGEYSVIELVTPEYRELVLESMQRKLAGEIADSAYEVDAICCTGEIRRVEIKSRLVRKGDKPSEIHVIARDITERRAVEEALAWEARVNSAMADVSSAILSIPSIDAMSELVLEHAKSLTGSEAGCVGFIDPKIDCFVCPAADDDPLRRLYPLGTGTDLAENDDFQAWIFNYRRPLVSNEVVHCERLPDFPGYDGQVTHLLSVPAMLGDELLGQIILVNPGRDYTERDLSCVERLSSLYAIAIKRKRTEDELRIQTSAINATSDQVVITDLQGRIEFVNPAFELETGYKAEEVIGQNPRILKSGKHDGEFYDRMWATIMSGETWQGEITNLCKNGSLVVEDIAITPIKDQNGKLEHFVAIKRNVTDRKVYEEQLDYLAYHDPLTGLPNRLLFSDRLTHRLTYAKAQNQRLAVMFLDIDRFKLINDTLGHNIGDLLLKGVAERLQTCLRDVDTIARMGGDEFTVIVSNVEDEEAVIRVANRIIDTLNEPFQLDNHELFISVSVGVSVYPLDGLDVETLVRNADTAMYRAKDRGRNNYQLFTEAFNAADVERMTLEYGLRRALERDEFLLHYQPQVDMKTGHTLGAESLIRWQHPEFGLVSPGKFIPLAEETGLIVPISKWVLRTACAQNKAWQDAGYPPMMVAVNVSAKLLHQDDLVQTVMDVLADTGLDARYLELELTESALMENTDTAISVLDKLKEMGVKVSVDDFGTGYSSLSYLKRFPIDSVKIDQSFVRDITTNPDDAAIAGAVVAMAHSLKLKVIAEGVETLEQLEFLRSLKCDEVQGYFISRPVPADNFGMILEEASDIWGVENHLRPAA